VEGWEWEAVPHAGGRKEAQEKAGVAEGEIRVLL
jgi:hypothetical protein